MNTEKVAENATLQVAARFSMLATPILLAGLSFFINHWWQSTNSDIAELQRGMSQTNERVTIVETNMLRGRQDREKFQEETRVQLDQIQTLLRTLAEGQAAINATLNAQQRQIDRQQPIIR